jgi:hypothetical protein
MIVDDAVILAFFADHPRRQRLGQICRYLGIEQTSGQRYDKVKSLLRSLANRGELLVDQRAHGCDRYWSLPVPPRPAAEVPAPAVDPIAAVEAHVVALRQLVDSHAAAMQADVVVRDAAHDRIRRTADRIRRASGLLSVIDPDWPGAPAVLALEPADRPPCEVTA